MLIIGNASSKSMKKGPSLLGISKITEKVMGLFLWTMGSLEFRKVVNHSFMTSENHEIKKAHGLCF